MCIRDRCWVDGGATDLDNLALVCRRHHRLVHAGWELAHRPDGICSATPPWAVPASRTDPDAALSRGPFGGEAESRRGARAARRGEGVLRCGSLAGLGQD